jgi:ERCC4-type nuclease
VILLDDRAGSGDLAPVLRQVGAQVEVVRLEFGDAALIGRGENEEPVRVGVEIKKVPDLLSSMTSGRLSGHQLPGLLASYEWVWVLVEGVVRPEPQTGVLQEAHGGGWRDVQQGPRSFMYRDVEHYLHSLVVRGGVHVAWTAGRHETARWLAALDSWWLKSWDEHKGHLAIHRKAGTRPRELVPPSLLRRVAAELPGIGWERSARVAGHFTSVREMVEASEEQWQQIDGVGKKLAASIRRALER